MKLLRFFLLLFLFTLPLTILAHFVSPTQAFQPSGACPDLPQVQVSITASGEGTNAQYTITIEWAGLSDAQKQAFVGNKIYVRLYNKDGKYVRASWAGKKFDNTDTVGVDIQNIAAIDSNSSFTASQLPLNTGEDAIRVSIEAAPAANACAGYEANQAVVQIGTTLPTPTPDAVSTCHAGDGTSLQGHVCTDNSGCTSVNAACQGFTCQDVIVDSTTGTTAKQCQHVAPTAAPVVGKLKDGDICEIDKQSIADYKCGNDSICTTNENGDFVCAKKTACCFEGYMFDGEQCVSKTNKSDVQQDRCGVMGISGLGTQCDEHSQLCSLPAAKELNKGHLPCATSIDPNGTAICPKVQSGIGLIPTTPAELIRFVFGLLLSLGGGIALILIMRSGYEIMASQGNPEKLQGARDTITSAIIGLLFIIFSLVILQIIGVDILRIPGLTPADTQSTDTGGKGTNF